MIKVIAENVLKERLRRKELYIVAVLGFLCVVIFSCCGGTITVDGELLTDFKNLAPVMLTIIHAISGALAIALSLHTIPNEYERKTSHLIWIRGVAQWKYHAALTLVNVISSLFAALIMYGGVILFALIKGDSVNILRFLPAYFLMALSIAIISSFTSLLSIQLPAMAAGLIACACYLLGILHGVLDILRNIVGGFSGQLLSVLLKILPDLNGMQQQAWHMAAGEPVDFHTVFKGLLLLYVLTIFYFIFKKKEA